MKIKYALNIGLVALALFSAALASGSTEGLHRVKGSIFVIVMENTNWSNIVKSTSAPYINSLLSHPQASFARNYNNPPQNHPSEPNYIWIEAGNNLGITDDKDPTNQANQIHDRNHFVMQLEDKGISWKAYQENISGTDCPLKSQGLYAAKHNPFVFFSDVTGNFSTSSGRCVSRIRPFSELAGDLAKNTVARYVFITPNLCNDMHNTCLPAHNRIQQGDDWLKRTVPLIMDSQAYKQGGALIITWDEAGSGDGPIGFVLLSPLAKGNGYSNNLYYNHGSLLRTLEEITGVPVIADVRDQRDLSDLFK